MSTLAFSVVSSRAEPFAAVPQLTLRVRIEESSGADIYAIGLRVQVMLETQRRRYGTEESPRLVELFGTKERYADTLRPMLWANVPQMVPAFSGSTEIDVPLPCSYDFEVAANKYLSALQDGEIPLNLLFSGTVMLRGEERVAAEFVSWQSEARYSLPVAVWRATMDAFFPGDAWIRIDRELFDELSRYKNAEGLGTWNAALGRLRDTALLAKAQR